MTTVKEQLLDELKIWKTKINGHRLRSWYTKAKQNFSGFEIAAFIKFEKKRSVGIVYPEPWRSLPNNTFKNELND